MRRSTEEQRLQEEALERLVQLHRSLLTHPPREAFFAQVLDAAIAVSGADFGQIQLLDPSFAGARIVAHRGFPDGWPAQWDRAPQGAATPGEALEAGQRTVVEDVEASPILAGTPALAMYRWAGVRAAESTPLIGVSGDAIGALSTFHKAPHRSSARVLRLLDLLARQTAALIERSDAARWQRFLAAAGTRLGASLDPDETLTSVVQVAVGEIADRAELYLIDADGEARRVRVATVEGGTPEVTEEPPIPRRRAHPVWRVADGKRAMVLEESGRGREVVGVPLLVGDRCLGGLFLESSAPSRARGWWDLARAEDFGRRAGIAVENARLHQALLRAVQNRDDLLGVVAHDLRNPLGNVLVRASLLRWRSTEPESRKAAEVIERAAGRMNRLIQDLLDVTRIDGGHLSVEPAPLPVSPTIVDFAQSQRSLVAGKSLVLRIDMPSDPGEVLADRDRLLQILENLVSNAVKFTKEGGTIAIGAEKTAGEVRFSVADTGSGIAPEDLPHVFDRFWQVGNGPRRGAGLGLAIVKGIVEAHGGRVWVESQPGVGSTFFFTIPTRGPLPQAPQRPSAASVLVAEDDRSTRDVLCATLQRAGYEVATAANGQEALEYLHREPPPALIILDLTMPVMDGRAFLAERNRDPALLPIPVVIVSGEPGLAEESLTAHASYLEKPVSPEHLLASVKEAIQ